MKKKKNVSPGQNSAAAGKTGAGQDMRIRDAMDIGLRHHQAGDLATAENIYRQVLQFEPDNPVALHLLGVAGYQRKDLDTAVMLISRAVAKKPDFADAHSNLGNALRDLGRIDEAEKCYRKAISINGRFAMAHYNLGLVLMARKRHDEAAKSFSRAIDSNPRLAEAHANSSIALRELGRLDEAEASCRKAIEIKPGLAIAHYNLGNILLENGRPEEATACYERALVCDPGYTEARLNLGAALRDLGKIEKAAACYELVLKKHPDNAELCVNYGAVLRDLGRAGDAEKWYRAAIDLVPDFALAHFNLGNTLRDQGRTVEAVEAYERAVALSPDQPAMYVNLGNALRDQGRREEAIDVYRKALIADPENAEALINLGNAFKEMGRYEEAEDAYRHALRFQPEMAEIHYNLGTVHQDLCRMDAAVACYRRALELKPDHAVAHSNLLMNIQYDPDATLETLLEESRAWERDQLAGVTTMPVPSNDPDPGRRLRIGYVSGDLRRHPVGYFLDRVLSSHDKSRFEICCYANQSSGDDLTERLRGNSGRWRDIFGESDEKVADLIQGDAIDILVDLSGHTARNRLKVFGRKPAPVQATWAGYVGTTGLSAMDYLISDPQETPEGTDRWYVEKIVRLPDCYVCYSPPEYAPPVAPLPARNNGFVTFGCFNNLAKINPRVVDLWARLLCEIPDARLLMITKALGDPTIREHYRGLFDDCGVGSRVDFSGMIPHRELLSRYGEVDIALDPFPYSGGLTTLEGLWMGVPAITLGGERFAARHSLSHLTAVGLAGMIASGEESYLQIASELARDLPRLETLRLGLRERMAASPLCDGPGFTRNLEEAYRVMWRRWCEEKKQG